MSDARTCPLGEDCDLTIAWMAGRADADRALAAERDALKAKAMKASNAAYQEKARAEAAEAEVARLREALRDVIGMLDDPTGGEHVRDMRGATVIARAALREPRP